MNVRLFIDGIEAELAENTEVAITRQAANVLQLDKRQLDFSNRVTIPATPNNIELMEYLGYNGNTSARPYKYAPARLEVNGITYADKLVCICDGIEENGFEIRLLGDPFNYLDQMKGKQLRDVLDLFTFNQHQLNPVSWKAFQTADEEITYPIIQQANPFVAFPKTRLYINLTYPAAYTKSLVEKMLNQYFTSVVSEAFTTEFLNKDVIFAADTESEVWKEYEKIIVDQSPGNNWFFFKPIFSTMYFGINYASGILQDNKSACKFYNQTGNDSDFYKFYGNGLTIYDSPSTRKYKLNIDIEFGIDDLSVNQRYRLELYMKPRANQLINVASDTLLAASDWFNATGVYSIKNEIDIFQGFDQGLYFVFKTEFAGTFPESIINLYINHFKIEINHEKQSLFYDEDMNVKLLMPDCTEFDFFMDQVKRFGLIFQTRFDGSIRLESFADVLSGKFGADIWTNKLVKVVSTNYELGDYGKTAYIQYKGERNGELLLGYNGWGFWTNDNDRYEEEKVVVESKGEAVRQFVDYFQPPFPNAISVGGFDIETSNLYSLLNPEKGIIYGRVNRTNAFLNDYNLYLLNDSPFIGNTFEILEAGFDDASNASLAEMASHITRYYGNLIYSLERPIVREVEVYLSEVDFYNLDFFKLIYLEQFQKYHYLLSVSNYIPGKIVKAKLLEVKGEINIPKCCTYNVAEIDLCLKSCVEFTFPEIEEFDFNPLGTLALAIGNEATEEGVFVNYFEVPSVSFAQFVADTSVLSNQHSSWEWIGNTLRISNLSCFYDQIVFVYSGGALSNPIDPPFNSIDYEICDPIIQIEPVFNPLTGVLIGYIFRFPQYRFQILKNGEWEDVTDEVTEDGTWSRTSCDETITQWRIIDIEDNVIDNGSVNCEENG